MRWQRCAAFRKVTQLAAVIRGAVQARGLHNHLDAAIACIREAALKRHQGSLSSVPVQNCNLYKRPSSSLRGPLCRQTPVEVCTSGRPATRAKPTTHERKCCAKLESWFLVFYLCAMRSWHVSGQSSGAKPPQVTPFVSWGTPLLQSCGRHVELSHYKSIRIIA